MGRTADQAPGLRRALTASAAIPIAFPPITLPDSETYVDGGVLENIPIEAAVRAGADEVIAILPSPAALPQPSAAPTTLFPVATRGMELLLDGSTRRVLGAVPGLGSPRESDRFRGSSSTTSSRSIQG